MFFMAPREGRAVTQQGHDSGRPVSADASKNVLVVEDQPLLRFLAADMLSEAGYGNTLAASAEEALDILSRPNEINLVFTDINMPGEMSGLALAYEIEGRWPHIGVVLTSGAANISRETLPAHSVFLPKPYQWEDVYSCLERVMH